MKNKEIPKSRFLLVKCGKCDNEQVIFNKPSTEVKCLVCNETICKPTGGLGNVKTKITDVLR
ncbi:MAG: 30S ribosomal protein S27e [Candidatus Aenigmatarchaeota archaeon]